MAVGDYRISKLKNYLFNVISNITNDTSFKINADFLGNVNDFSLDKIPTESTIERYVIGYSLHRDVYSFRSRKPYSKDIINNLENIGFFEEFEDEIKSNNDKGDLPDIDNIESIECLNCGTLNSVDGTEAIFDIQIQVTYMHYNKKNIVSL